VRLELGHLSAAGDAARLADPAFRDTVAEAVLVAVQRLYLPPDLDPPTGVLRLPDLASL
jgi:N-acetylmuramoyl-L-alanine amidase